MSILISKSQAADAFKQASNEMNDHCSTPFSKKRLDQIGSQTDQLKYTVKLDNDLEKLKQWFP